MKRFVFWIWALCAAAPGFADQVTIDGVTWTYSVRSREGASYAVIEEASGVQGAVTVPATLGGAPVTEFETGFLGMSGVFYGCTELTEVRWEEGCAIEKIGGYAFRGCTSLTQITIPPSVTKLGNQAFRGSGLESVTIPGTVKTLGAEVFAECPDLKTAVFEEGDELYDADVGDGLFVACPELETVTLKRLRTLSDSFFLDCPKLTSVSLPTTLWEIKDGAFSLSPNIAFTLDAGVTRFSVENGLLRSATGLCYVPGNPERLEIPDGITDISGGVCRGKTNLREVTVPDTLKSIGTFAFYGCTSLEEIDLSGTQVTTLPEGAFANCPALAWVRLPATFGSFMMDSTFAYSPNVRFEVAEACKSFSSDALGTLYDKDKTVLFIGPNVASFTVPETVTAIAPYAFDGHTALTSITLPASVRDFGYDVFRGCTNLTPVNGLVLDAEQTTVLGIDAGKTAVAAEDFPETVWRVADYAFYENTSLLSAAFPSWVTSIGAFAFYYCDNLGSVTFAEGLEEIRDGAFYSTGIGGELNLPTTLTDLGDLAFGNTNVMEVKMGGTPGLRDNPNLTLAGNPFAECYGLPIDPATGVRYETAIENNPRVVVGVGGVVVDDAGQETEVEDILVEHLVLPESVRYICDEGLDLCPEWDKLALLPKTIEVPGPIYRVGSGAIRDGYGLTSITFDGDVGEVDTKAFTWLSALQSVTFKGDVGVVRGNVFWESLGDLGALEGASCSLTFEGNVGTIESLAFDGNVLYEDWGYNPLKEYLASVTFGGSVGSIGARAFRGLAALPTVTFGGTVGPIGDWAFYGCSSLRTVTGCKPESLGVGAFYGCSALTGAPDLSRVAEVPTEAFRGCTALTEVTLADAVTLGENAFYGCAKLTGLKTASGGDPTVTLATFVFYECAALTGITLDPATTEIDGDPKLCLLWMRGLDRP